LKWIGVHLNQTSAFKMEEARFSETSEFMHCTLGCKNPKHDRLDCKVRCCVGRDAVWYVDIPSFCCVGRDAVWYVDIPSFRRNLLIPSSELERERERDTWLQ
jgi:hypothetical protein